MSENVTTRCGFMRVARWLHFGLLVVFLVSVSPAETVYSIIPKKTVSGASVNQVWKSIVTGISSAREDHTAVWTGSEMIIWGGHNDNNILYDSTLNDGARYSATTNSWTLLSTTNSPLSRDGHTAVWTGSEM